jgi:Fe-Mn family superoxide dismutase
MKPAPHFELPPLGYAYNALEPRLSAEILELHYSKHHKAYVDGLNKALTALAEAREKGDFGKVNQLEKDLAFNYSGHVLHSLFWRNLEPGDGAGPSGALEKGLKAAFGSVDAFRKQFSAAGQSVQGSGWAALVFEPTRQTLLVEQIHDHQDRTAVGSLPLLVMDMWEHAYYLQYRNKKDQWIGAFWELVNWADVARRLARVSGIDLGLTGGQPHSDAA